MARELREVFFVDGVRTAFGRAGPKGQFWRTRADDMGVKAVRELLRRNPEIQPERIGDVVLAATAQVGDQGLTLGRDVALLAGIPDSVPGFAVDRMCAGALTAVTAATGETFQVQAGPETLERTNLGNKSAGDRVNLERALKVGARLGGHFVQGHIDTTATLRNRRREEEWEFLALGIEPAWTPLLVSKGSIAVDGASLTLVDVGHDAFSVMLIPHTLKETTLGKLNVGDDVPLETDILAKYAAKAVLVSDDMIRQAQELLWDRLRLVAEPGGCVALAALTSGGYSPDPGETVAVVISGANTTAVRFGG